MDVKKIGVLCIIAASLMWAIEPIVVKIAYSRSSFITTFTIRTIVISLIAVGYIFFTNKGKFKVNRKEIPMLAYVAIVGTLVADLLYYFALTKVAVINAVLIGHMQPVFIVLIGFFILKEDKLTKFDYIGIIIMTFASLMVTTRTIENLLAFKLGTWGDVFVLMSTISWASVAIVARKYLRTMNVGVLVFYRYSVAAVALIVYLMIQKGLGFPNIYQILSGVIVGIGVLLYYEGLKRIKAAQVTSLELTTPFFAAIFGFLFLKEVVTFMQIIGILLLVFGIYFISKKEETYF